MFPKSLLPSEVFQRNVNPASYRPEIDGLRFFAIAIVMIGHLLERIHQFWIAPNPSLDNGPVNAVLHFFASPNQGVLLFFAISGFIIAKQMQDVPAGRFTPDFIGKYYVRRMTRIFPPYYLIILSSFFVFYFLQIVPPGLNRTAESDVSLPASLAASLFYAHGAVFDSLPRLYGLGWSLEVEVQFYLIAPLIFLTLFRGDDRFAGWRIALMLSVFFAVSFVVMNKIVPVNSFTVLSYIIYFGVGIALARHEAVWQRLFARVGSRASLALGMACVLGMFWFGNAHFQPLAMTLVYWALSLGTIAILFGLAFQPDTMFGRLCRLPYITYIGLACYSLYLIHLQIFHMATLLAGDYMPMNYFTVFAGFAVIMAGGLLAGYIFFVLIEKPFAAWRPSGMKARKPT